jgi:hypothetical protein
MTDETGWINFGLAEKWFIEGTGRVSGDELFPHYFNNV